MKPHVVISGANGNLGQFVVKKFLNENWLVTALVQPGTYLENLEKSDSLKIVMIDLDIESTTDNTIEQIGSQNKIDACLMLAGGFAMDTIDNTNHESLQKMINLNFYTAYHLAQATFKHFKKNKIAGRLVFMGARPAIDVEAGKNMLSYSLSKSMIFQLAELLNAAGKEHNIVSSVIVPSIIDTPANRSAMPNDDFSKWVTPESIASLIFITCSELGKGLRNTVLKVYGES